MTHRLRKNPAWTLCCAAAVGLCAAVLLSLAGPGWVSAKDAEPGEGIDGVWRVTRVELAGKELHGLGGAELTLAGGKKSFKLPSASVEKGTYTLDAKADPKQID